jgi:hypothetical protein
MRAVTQWPAFGCSQIQFDTYFQFLSVVVLKKKKSWGARATPPKGVTF